MVNVLIQTTSRSSQGICTGACAMRFPLLRLQGWITRMGSWQPQGEHQLFDLSSEWVQAVSQIRALCHHFGAALSQHDQEVDHQKLCLFCGRPKFVQSDQRCPAEGVEGISSTAMSLVGNYWSCHCVFLFPVSVQSIWRYGRLPIGQLTRCVASHQNFGQLEQRKNV